MNHNNTYDVSIIGGGLAGLSLAIQLSRKKYKVLLLEKDDYPRHKVCGEYISLESRPFLEDLGLPVSEIGLPVINRLQITDAKGNVLNTKLPQGGFGISRFCLDEYLARLARQAGATLLTRTKADDVRYDNELFYVDAGNKVFQSKLVCGSWGKRGNLDIKWDRDFIREEKQSLNNYIAIKYHVNYPHPEHLIALHNFKDGYCGISRVEGGKCCLCLLTTGASLRNAGNDIKLMEQQTAMRNPYLYDIYSKATFLYEQPLAISRISFQQKEQEVRHVMMIGDAAGLITPLCGNGMSMAFHASKIAFKEIDNFLRGKTTLSAMMTSYKRQWNREFSTRLATGRFLQSRFGKEHTTGMFMKVMKALPFLQKPLINATSGKPF